MIISPLVTDSEYKNLFGGFGQLPTEAFVHKEYVICIFVDLFKAQCNLSENT
jgi:hypothetical protein